jgi:hypothetical protein
MFMEKELSIETIKTFNIDGIESPVSFVETMQVADGVKCDTYTFDNRDDVDLGIIKIQPNFKTPRQKVLDGENTVEGYISGKGKLVVERNYGHTDVYDTGTNGKIKVNVGIGDIMQWIASEDTPLMAYELCYPPYKMEDKKLEK